jgi:hypothetical protein
LIIASGIAGTTFAGTMPLMKPEVVEIMCIAQKLPAGSAK